MNKLCLTTLITILALTPWSARAEDKPANPLDRALDDIADTIKPAPAKTADKPADVLNPDAANALDTDDLVNKLTGKGPKSEGPDAMMKEIVGRMNTSAQRLHERDTGALTQETQKRIVLNLDQLIELVRQQQQKSSSQSQGKPQDAQKRQQTKPQNGPPKQGGNTAAQNSVLPNGGAAAPEANGTDINQRSREWGNLPERERDLIVHGAKEESLPSYKELIQRYYQSLAEINKTTNSR